MMIKVFKRSYKYLTWDQVGKLMRAKKRKAMGFGHVEFDVEEVTVEKTIEIKLYQQTNSWRGRAGDPNGERTIKPGSYFHMTMEYTTK